MSDLIGVVGLLSFALALSCICFYAAFGMLVGLSIYDLFTKVRYIDGPTAYRIIGPYYEGWLQFKHKNAFLGITLPGTRWSNVPRPYSLGRYGRDPVLASKSSLFQVGSHSRLAELTQTFPCIVDYMAWFSVEQKKLTKEAIKEEDELQTELNAVTTLTNIQS